MRRAILCAAVCLCAVMVWSRLPVAGAADQRSPVLVSLDTEWSKAAAAKDVDKLASFYDDDAVLYPPDQAAVHGRAAARKMWAQDLSDPGSHLSWTARSSGVNGNIGFTAGTYEETNTGADGKKTTATGKYLCVWRKDAEGKWKAIHDMWNSDAK